jgi:hypothetical protein
MRERPISFNSDMVRAILAGAKTQTRRPVKPRKDINFGCELSPGELAGEINRGGDYQNCPFGQPGDRLWVRESGRVEKIGYSGEWAADIRYSADSALREVILPRRIVTPNGPPSWAMGCRGIPNGIFREAARIHLEIVSVRVERLEDITIADAQAEGFPGHGAIIPFIQTWERIYGRRGFGCDAKPWLWVIEFRRVTATEAK